MKKFLLLLLGTASLGACKKDSETTPTATRTDMLTAKNWRETAYTTTIASSGKSTTTDEYATYSACERDDFTRFHTDKTVIFDEGPTKCSTSSPQTEVSTWDFNGDQTKLTLPALGGLLAAFDIVELSSTTLHLRLSKSQVQNGVTVTSTSDITFAAF